MYAARNGRGLGRLARAHTLRGRGRGLGDGDGFDWSDFTTNLVNDAAKVAAVAVQPTTSVRSSVSPSGVQSYSYSAPAYGTSTGVASITGSPWIWIAGLGLIAVLLARR